MSITTKCIIPVRDLNGFLTKENIEMMGIYRNSSQKVNDVQLTIGDNTCIFSVEDLLLAIKRCTLQDID